MVGLLDEGASFIAPKKDKTSSLLAMVSLEYVGERNSPSLRVHLRGKGQTTKTGEYHAHGSLRQLKTGTKSAFHLFIMALTP